MGSQQKPKRAHTDRFGECDRTGRGCTLRTVYVCIGRRPRRTSDGRTDPDVARTHFVCDTTLSTGSAARLGTHAHTQRVSPSAPGPGPTLRPCGPTHDQRHCVLALKTLMPTRNTVYVLGESVSRPCRRPLSLSYLLSEQRCRQPCNHAAMMGSASWSGLFGPKSCFRTFRRNLLFFPNLPTFSSIG